MAEQESAAVAVVRSRQHEGLARQRISSERTDETVATAAVDTYRSIFPVRLQKAASEFAAASGLSLNQFIADAVAAAVADK